MTITLPTLIATSVVRGSQQGESHGGVFTIDFQNKSADRVIDWNTGDIDWSGRGADRGLRGICFDGEDVFIAASDELFQYDRNFNVKGSFRNRYLKHCHEISRQGRHIFLSSTGFDSLLAFDLDEQKFTWGFHLLKQNSIWSGFTFDPLGDMGPAAINDHHINMVLVNDKGIYMSGLRTNALLHLTRKNEVVEVCNLPAGTHNAQPFKEGVLFNDTASDCVRFVSRDGDQRAFKIKTFDEEELEFAGVDDSRVARQGFGRGLCAIDDRLIAAGSSPSTISIYDLVSDQTVASVNLTMDIRNAIHGLEVWPLKA